MMIKTNRPAIAGTKYVSATDAGVAVGAAVAAGRSYAIVFPLMSYSTSWIRRMLQ